MKRTERSKANSRQEKISWQKSIANSRQKSIANSRQKSIANSRQDKSIANRRQDKSKANRRQDKSKANSRQSKPKDCDRDKAKCEGKYTTEEKLQSASQSRSIQEPIQMSSRDSRGKKR